MIGILFTIRPKNAEPPSLCVLDVWLGPVLITLRLGHWGGFVMLSRAHHTYAWQWQWWPPQARGTIEHG